MDEKLFFIPKCLEKLLLFVGKIASIEYNFFKGHFQRQLFYINSDIQSNCEI